MPSQKSRSKRDRTTAPSQLVDAAALGQRMEAAHVHLISHIRQRVTLTELADRVSKKHPDRTFTPTQIQEYKKGKARPWLDVIQAYALATEVDPGWLAFGDRTQAPAPPGWVELAGEQRAQAMSAESFEPKEESAETKRRRGA